MGLRHHDGPRSSCRSCEVALTVTSVLAPQRPTPLLGTYGPVAVIPLDKTEANGLLVAWEHELGECNRPFGQDHWGLVVNDHLVSMAVTASIVSPTIED